MFDVIWNALKDEFGVLQFNSIMGSLGVFIQAFEQDYFKDQNAKNAAIDAICQILQQYKSK